MPRVFPPILNLNWGSRFQRAKGLAEHRRLQVSLRQRFRNEKEIGADSWCPPTIRFREFEGQADYTATTKDRKTNSAAQGLTFYDSPFASYWMRESAQMADSEIIESGDVASRWSSSVILW